MGAAREDLLHNDYPTVGDVAGKAASALLRGARGNSGVITSLLFRGFSKGLKHKAKPAPPIWWKRWRSAWRPPQGRYEAHRGDHPDGGKEWLPKRAGPP